MGVGTDRAMRRDVNIADHQCPARGLRCRTNPWRMAQTVYTCAYILNNDPKIKSPRYSFCSCGANPYKACKVAPRPGLEPGTYGLTALIPNCQQGPAPELDLDTAVPKWREKSATANARSPAHEYWILGTRLLRHHAHVRRHDHLRYRPIVELDVRALDDLRPLGDLPSQ